jgi:hypothetical protein
MDAMEALVEWNVRQKPLYDQLRRETDVSYAWFEKVLAYAKLASVFPKKHRDTPTAQKEIARILTKFKNEQAALDYVIPLSEALEPFTAYGDKEEKRGPLTMASLLMWFFNRDDNVVYTVKSRKALQRLIRGDQFYEMAGNMALQSELEVVGELAEGEWELDFSLDMPLDLKSYLDYHHCWIDIYLDNVNDIQVITDNLLQLCEYEAIPEGYDWGCLTQEWFHRRVFATWLNRLIENLPPKRRIPTAH